MQAWLESIISQPTWQGWYVLMGMAIGWFFNEFNKYRKEVSTELAEHQEATDSMEAQILAALTDINTKLDIMATESREHDHRLDCIDEAMFYVLDATLQLGANGIVKKYRDRTASGGRWKDYVEQK